MVFEAKKQHRRRTKSGYRDCEELEPVQQDDISIAVETDVIPKESTILRTAPGLDVVQVFWIKNKSLDMLWDN